MNKTSLISILLIITICQFSCNNSGNNKKIYSGDKKTDSKSTSGCVTPVATATVNGNRYFKTCAGDAHVLYSNLNFFAKGEEDMIGLNFNTGINNVKPGTYKITQAALKTPGQDFVVNGGYFLQGDMPKNNHQCTEGTITLTIADGQHFKGTFEMTCQQKDSKEIIKVTDGTFELVYNPEGDRPKKKNK